MGYYTDFNGEIRFSTEAKAKMVEFLIKENINPFESWFLDEIEFEKNILNISANWKDYDNSMLKLCYAILQVDKKAVGEIYCKGEENEDMWKIKIEDGRVARWIANISYVPDETFGDYPIEQEVKKILRRKDIKSRMIINEL